MTIRNGLMDFVDDLSIVITSIMLFFVYFIGVGLTFLFSRLFQKRFLDLRKKQNYWSNLNLNKKDLEEYYKQY
jgi:hypothetical protein